MGNYGPDLMHWYHYGAVMIWSPDANASLLLTQSTTSQLNWISYFNRTQQATKAEATSLEFIVSTGLNSNRRSEREANYTKIFKQVTETIPLPVLEQLVAVLREMSGNKQLRSLAATQTDNLPDYFETIYSRDTHGVKAGTLSLK